MIIDSLPPAIHYVQAKPECRMTIKDVQAAAPERMLDLQTAEARTLVDAIQKIANQAGFQTKPTPDMDRVQVFPGSKPGIFLVVAYKNLCVVAAMAVPGEMLQLALQTLTAGAEDAE